MVLVSSLEHHLGRSWPKCFQCSCTFSVFTKWGGHVWLVFYIEASMMFHDLLWRAQCSRPTPPVHPIQQLSDRYKKLMVGFSKTPAIEWYHLRMYYLSLHNCQDPSDSSFSHANKGCPPFNITTLWRLRLECMWCNRCALNYWRRDAVC